VASHAKFPVVHNFLRA